jgi:hypothetical protein
MYNISSSSSCFFLLIFSFNFFKLFKSRSEGERRGKRHGGRRLFSSSSVARFQFHQRIRDDTHSFSHLRRRRFLLLSSSKEINLLVTFFIFSWVASLFFLLEPCEYVIISTLYRDYTQQGSRRRRSSSI